MPFEFWSPLGPTLRYFGSRLMDNAGSALWWLLITEWVFCVAVYLVWEAHNTCRPSYRLPDVLLALQTLLLQKVSGAVGYQDLKLYLACIGCTD